MRFNFRQISAIATSALMVGTTMGLAAAANYPAPFVSGGVANVAVVYGTGTGVSAIDQIQAGTIQANLGTFTTGTGSSTATGGDSVRLGKSSDEVNIGDGVDTEFGTTVDEDDLADLLADGTYTDDDNTDYDYTQKVTLGTNLDVTHFSDSDYDSLIGASDRTPTVGIRMTSSVHVLNYTIDFSTHPTYNAATLETTTMRLMGRDYYVLDVTNGTSTNKTTFLDSANSAVVTDGQTTTVSGKSVGISFISSTEVRLDVDGTITNSLAEGATYKLADGTYVGVKDILYDSKEAGVSKVEISIGTGKLEISHGAAVELNDDTVEEIIGFLVQDSTVKLDKIVLMWTTEDEEYITPAASLTMPAFAALKLSMGPYTKIGSGDVTEIDGGSDTIELQTTIKDGAVTIPLLGANSTGEFTTIGKDSTNKLFTNKSAAGVYRVFNESAGDKYMVLSWNNTRDVESYYLKLDTITEDNIWKARITNEVTGDSRVVSNSTTVSFGNAEITITNITNSGVAPKVINFTVNSGSDTHILYTDTGLKMWLPHQVNGTAAYENETGSVNLSGLSPEFYVGNRDFDAVDLFFDSEDRDGNVGAGDAFNITVDESGTTNKVHVQTVTTDSASSEIANTDDFEFYTITDVTSKLIHYTGGDYDSVKITYSGDDSFVNLYLSSPETVVSGGNIGEILVKDSEVSSVSSKNLIVVGGSCINSVAASLVGGTKCGSAWTTATGVGSGQFLIQSFARDGGKVALLVAGYDVADTQNAVTYLKTKDVDTVVGKKYIGTTSTSAQLQVA